MISRALGRRAILLGGAATLTAGAAPSPVDPSGSDGKPIARHILALYDGEIERTLKLTNAHSLAATPLEFLGLTLHYHDIRDDLPPIWEDAKWRGVLTWLLQPSIVHYDRYVAWIERVAAAGRRVVQVGEAASKPGLLPPDTETALRRRLFVAMHMQSLGHWTDVTIGDRIVHAQKGSVGFECGFDAGLPAFELYAPGQTDTQSWLIVERADRARSRSHVIMVSGSGGFIAPGYAMATDPQRSLDQWSVDPVAFFAAAFATDDLPAPDTTTFCGRRLYYSHIDGDGWRSISQIRGPNRAAATCAEIMLEQVVTPHPDLPVTIAPIAAEMDPGFAGDLRAISAARKLFRLPQVEPATHTYTHPFRWKFFEHYSAAAEAPFQSAYGKSASGALQMTEAAGDQPTGSCCGRARTRIESPPRAFGGRPFDLQQEVAGSRQMIQSLAPSDKPVRLLQWPGDCTPFIAAIKATADAGLLNINGGDTRCDDDFPSISAVAPIGFQAKGLTQIYASNSSEELYTDLWTDRYFGFRDLPTTWDRTNSPRRLKPINLYYHMYSAERRASVDALLQNIAAVREREVHPVTASQFAAVAQGFFTTELERKGPASWAVHDRGALNTIRFAGTDRMLDLLASHGALGERIVNGDLYVALDPADTTPLIVLISRQDTPPPRPMLVQSAWAISGLRATSTEFRFRAAGFGRGVMEWRVPGSGRWRADTADAVDIVPEGDHLAFELPEAANGATVTVRRVGS